MNRNSKFMVETKATLIKPFDIAIWALMAITAASMEGSKSSDTSSLYEYEMGYASIAAHTQSISVDHLGYQRIYPCLRGSRME
jgi:hypothetical protein